MFDLETEFNIFYRDYVVLSKDEKQNLYNKKDLNLDRLKDGLQEYNEEKKTEYKIKDNVVQGSVAMSTVTQNDKHDYDIDVAVIFDKDNIPSGTTAVKNIVVNSLKKKCKQFKTEPEAKTNCVRVAYEEGYHIDFAVYRRFKNDSDEFEYEHCGSEWSKRDPRTITNWFIENNKAQDYKLRKIVRLLKMFCKSREHWVMPGGLIHTVLVVECFEPNDRIDKSFYNTIKATRDRLKNDKEVKNPVDDSLSLIIKESDKTKVENLYNRLSTYIDKLDILFTDGCTKEQAIEAWNDFFNHSYWSDLLTEDTQKANESAYCATETFPECDETEEFIEHIYPIDIKYDLNINCRVTQDGWRTKLLRSMLRLKEPLRLNKNLEFFIEGTNVPPPYKVFWKVRNIGDVAEQKNCIRGQIVEDKGKNTKKEETSFRGPHFVECYIVRYGVCVARSRIDVPINIL
ncbi:nucleotide-binding domain-containing protein [Desulfofalx alkaliphila]|uniref:nucleotide-binding domain-containing protein n=1 Tax=Desulfofalx alkaliphila TaxID=105483 RepID=UPI0004E21AB1|nr:nucleotidyltransferase [Desulfofalx alkaliphila]